MSNDPTTVRAALLAVAPDSEVSDDPAMLALVASDIFWTSPSSPLAMAAPASERDVAAIVRLAAQRGWRILPRGGGVSYTKGYLSEQAGTIVLDMRRLDRVITLATDDGYVEVESGCTWATLHAALADTGYTTGYWGPFSGLVSTVGGAVSQNSGGFGSARHGTVAESVIGLSVVLADGAIVNTGSAARTAAKPFSRINGPDLTGLFLGDNGAFGVKTRIVLRLRRKPQAVGFLSFGFPTLDAMTAAQCRLARSELVNAGYGFDRLKASLATRSMTASDGARVLYNIARSETGLGGLARAATVLTSGTGFLSKHPYSLHLTIEADTDAQLTERQHAVVALAAADALPSSVPQALHANPFGPLRGMLGPDGERWVPVHALFPLSATKDVVTRWEQFVAERAGLLEAHEIQISLLTMTVGYEFFLEPAFYWPDELLPIHHATLGDKLAPAWRARKTNAAAREAVKTLRKETQELFASLGGTSWQIARDYPFREYLDPACWALLEAIKKAVDPRSTINPGSLGIGSS
ncbi:MAG TPA: FAD-binding oxidoreductase [Pseudolabrys sp.]|nr:FAD-binding oxidoreductase [Pseudolabrys sp.]